MDSIEALANRGRARSRRPTSPLTLVLVALQVCAGARVYAQDYTSTTRATAANYEAAPSGAVLRVDTESARSGQLDAATVLQEAPELRVRRTGALNGPAYVSIRGSEPSAVRFMLDGIPLHGANTVVFDINSLLPETFERIDVYRTLVPVELGYAGAGGTVNLRLRDGLASQTASIGGGAWWTRRALVGAGHTFDGGDIIVNASYRGTRGDFRFYDTNGTSLNEDDDNPEARRSNNDFNQGAVFATSTHELARGTLRLLTLADVREGGVSGLDVFQGQSARTRQQHYLLGLRGEHRVGARSRADIDWTASFRAQRLDYDDRDNEIGFGAQDRQDRELHAYLSVGTALWLHRLLTIRVRSELEWEHYRPQDDLDELLLRRATRLAWYGGLAADVRTEDRRLRAHASIAGRVYDQRNDSNDAPAAPRAHVTDAVLLPQLGVTWRAFEEDRLRWEVAGYASQAHRQPGFSELYGDNGASVGNPELSMERHTTLEVASTLQYTKGDWRLDAAFAYWRQWRRDAIVYVALPSGARKPFNLDGADAAGQEFQLAARWKDSRVYVRAARLVTSNRSADPQERGRQLPWRSPWTVSAGVDAQVHELLQLGTRYRFDSRFYGDTRNLRPYPSVSQLDLSVTLRSPRAAWPSVRVDMTNVLNTRTSEVDFRSGGVAQRVTRPLSDFQGYPRPGRGVFVTFTWRWNDA